MLGVVCRATEHRLRCNAKALLRLKSKFAHHE
jgi:hypothetical protein